MTNSLPRYLTKSRFKEATVCPTKLYYTGKAGYANTNSGNEFMEMLANGGFQVGELAKLMYPGGIEIKSKNIADALAETAVLLAQEDIVLFEPAIVHGNFLVRVDILIKHRNLIEVIEVKAKSYSGDPASLKGKRSAIESKILPYVQDVAFQTYVVRLAFPQTNVSAFLLMPDKSKHATVSGINQWFKVRRDGRNTEVLVDSRAAQPGLAETLLTCVQVDHLVDEILNHDIRIPGGKGSLRQLARIWASAYVRDERIAPVIGAHCNHCEYKAPFDSELASGFHECWKLANNWTNADFAAGTVLDLWNSKSKEKLIHSGVVKLNQVTREHLKLKGDVSGALSNAHRQWLQVSGLPNECEQDGYYLDREGLAHEMKGWTYPLHMIDFETASVALPFHVGRRPYEQVAFQFSHHVIEKDGKVRHADEFLHTGIGEFPNYEFVRALRKALCQDQGTIFRWDHHENSILNTIKNQLNTEDNPPADIRDLVAFINSITVDGDRAMVDLAAISCKHYFHPLTKGSYSIKVVLPAVLSSSPFLKETYGRPLYGAQGGVPSKNFTNWAWWQQDDTGAIRDPYKLLGSNVGSNEENTEPNTTVNQGGAASYAYLRLQFEDIPAKERASLESALRKYCEVDTMAMVMILQAWIH